MATSPALIAELADVMSRAKFRTLLARSNTDTQRILAEFRILAEIFDPNPLLKPISRDRDDDAAMRYWHSPSLLGQILSFRAIATC